MEPNLENVSNEIVSASSSAASTADKTPKTSKGLLVATIIFAVIAIAGIAAAIYFFIDANNKATTNADLRAKLDLVKMETGAELVEKEENGTTVTVVETVNSVSDPEDYVFVGEWGIKIKIPDNLSEVSYIYNNNRSGSLCLTGAKYDGQQYGPEFLDITKNELGCVMRVYEKDTDYYQGLIPGPEAAIISEGEYYWVYTGPQSVYSVTESEQQWEVESVELIRDMLKNKDNYSKI